MKKNFERRYVQHIYLTNNLGLKNVKDGYKGQTYKNRQRHETASSTMRYYFIPGRLTKTKCDCQI